VKKGSVPVRVAQSKTSVTISLIEVVATELPHLRALASLTGHIPKMTHKASVLWMNLHPSLLSIHYNSRFPKGEGDPIGNLLRRLREESCTLCSLVSRWSPLGIEQLWGERGQRIAIPGVCFAYDPEQRI
jgi:hypothetical protein